MEIDNKREDQNGNKHHTPPNSPLWDSQFFGGIIDEVRIYNRALTANEVKSLMYVIGKRRRRLPRHRYEESARARKRMKEIEWECLGINPVKDKIVKKLMEFLVA